MDKESYEKPELTTIDLGNLIDEAEAEAVSAQDALGRISREAEAMKDCLESLLADFRAVEDRIEEIKKKNLMASTIVELKEAQEANRCVHGNIDLMESPCPRCEAGEAQFTQEEQRRIDERLCFGCGHEAGDHDESCCKGGEDTLCRCDCFEDPREP